MKSIIFDGVPNTRITVVALDRILKKAGIGEYRLTETRLADDSSNEYFIPVFILGVELSDEDATLISLKYSAADIVNELNAVSREIISKLKSHAI